MLFGVVIELTFPWWNSLKVKPLLIIYNLDILGRDLIVEYMHAIKENVKKFVSLSEGRNLYTAAIVKLSF